MTESLTLIAGTSSLPCFLHLVEAMHAGGGLFGDAVPFLHDLVPALRVLGVHLLEQILDDLLFVAAAMGVLTQSLPFSSS